MNVCFNQDSIRLRLSEEEFINLKATGALQYDFDYYPLHIKIAIIEHGSISKVSNVKIDVMLTSDELNQLIIPDTQKSGVMFFAKTETNEEVVLYLQVDLRKVKF